MRREKVTESSDAQTGEGRNDASHIAGQQKGACAGGMSGEGTDLIGLFGRKVVLPVSGIFFAGLLYLAWFQTFGFGIPCVFHLITGYLCPGCGITRALSLAFHLRFREAFSHNALSITVFPIICLYLLYRRVREAVFGKSGFAVWEYVFLIAAFAITALYGIARNL